MKSIPASILGYVILTVILTAGAAQSLTGTNTVDSGDIVDGTIKNIDIKPSTITGSRILDNSVGAADLAANAVGNAEMADGAIGEPEVADHSLRIDDFATAKALDQTATPTLNANTCVDTTIALTGAAVGDLPIVVLRSSNAGATWDGRRVTTANQFTLRGCNWSSVNFAASVRFDVFTVRP